MKQRKIKFKPLFLINFYLQANSLQSPALTTFGRYLLDFTIIEVSHSTPLSIHFSNPPLQHCLPKFFLKYSSSTINAGLIAVRQLGQRQNSRITVYSQEMIAKKGQKIKTFLDEFQLHIENMYKIKKA